MSYAQNREDLIVAKYFNGQKGTLLSIGENDGITLSNSRLLIEQGWKGLLVEPSPKAFAKLKKLYGDNKDIELLNSAVADYVGKSVLHESGTHLAKGDSSLLSTLNQQDYEKWKDTTIYTDIEINVTDVRLMLASRFKTFDFITIDAEGNDLLILQQLDLTALDCRCICIEWNGDYGLLNEIKDYCVGHGLNVQLAKNAENIILAR